MKQEELKNVEVLVIPDVHGRDFWREPVKEVLENTSAHIVFLGDYVDPYPDEWKDTGIDCREYCVDGFVEIIDLKKRYPDRITLLVGNHDLGYVFGHTVCSCRMDYSRNKRISNIFNDNWFMFNLVYGAKVGNKDFIFSHAGISKEYMNFAFTDYVPDNEQLIDFLNNALETRDNNLVKTIGLYSRYRGWDGYVFGSIVWSDINEWLYNKCTPINEAIQIVGHTQLKEAINVWDKIYCLDARETFFIDDEGNVKYYKDSDKTLLHIEK